MSDKRGRMINLYEGGFAQDSLIYYPPMGNEIAVTELLKIRQREFERRGRKAIITKRLGRINLVVNQIAGHGAPGERKAKDIPTAFEQDCYVMHTTDGLSFSEIGHRCNKTRQCISKAYYRAQQKLGVFLVGGTTKLTCK